MTVPADQAALISALTQDLAGVDAASVYGKSRNFEAGTGRVAFKGAQLYKGQKTMFIVECVIKWFRGGITHRTDSNGKVIAGSQYRVPDDTFKEGDELAFKVNLAWKNGAAFPHIKGWAWALMQLAAKAKGHDPALITVDMITKETVAQVLANWAPYDGIECDFEAVADVTQTNGLFTNVRFLPHRDATPPPMTASTAAPVPTAAPAAAPAASPLAALTGQGNPTPALPAATPQSGTADPLAALTGAVAPSQAAAPSAPAGDPLAALTAAVAPPANAADPLAALAAAAAPAALTRDQKIAHIRQKDARFAAADFTTVDDATIDAAFNALP